MDKAAFTQAAIGLGLALVHYPSERGGTTTKPSLFIELAASFPEALIKWPTGSFPQLHNCDSLVELVSLLLLFRSIVPRIARPSSPLSCNGAAKELQANNKNIKPNIIEFFISLTIRSLPSFSVKSQSSIIRAS